MKWTIIIVFILLLVVTSFQIKAQTVLESTVTNEAFIMETWWTKSIDKEYKFVLFNLNTAEYNFDLKEIIFMSYSILNMDLFKGFGLVVGTRILKDRVVGLGGLQYTYFREEIFITTNFTSEFRENPDFEFFSLIQYKPQITEKIKGFIQGQFSFNFNSDTHIFSFQQLRLGADLGLIQTGLAINQFQFEQDWLYNIQPGFFLRLEFK